MFLYLPRNEPHPFLLTNDQSCFYPFFFLSISSQFCKKYLRLSPIHIYPFFLYVFHCAWLSHTLARLLFYFHRDSNSLPVGTSRQHLCARCLRQLLKTEAPAYRATYFLTRKENSCFPKIFPNLISAYQQAKSFCSANPTTI